MKNHRKTRQIGLLLRATGIYVTFILSNLILEQVISPGKENTFNNYTFLAFAQYLISSLLALLLMSVMNTSSYDKPSSIWSYIGIALGRFSSNQLGLWSLNFVSYPTLIVSRSNKLLPVVITNYVVFNVKTKPSRVFKVFLMTIGLFLFMYFDKPDHPKHENTTFGVLLLVLSLFIEGLTSSMQEFTFRRNKPHFLDMMFHCSALSLIPSMLIILPPFSDQLFNSMSIFFHRPHIFCLILFATILNALGHCIVFSMVKEHGALSLIIVTSTRKMLSVIFSVFIYGHTVNVVQWTGIVLVFVPMMISDRE